MSQTITLGSYHCAIYSSAENDARITVCNTAGTIVGILHFAAGTEPLPAARQVGSLYHFYFRRSSYADIVDMLRNESPVYLIYKSGDVKNSRIVTSTVEPPGEED